jgi:AraC-like DNA-binding protein
MLPGRRAQAWRHQPAFQRPRHFHEEPELNLITCGSATFGIGDATVSAERGDVLVFHPGQDHVLLSASADLGLFAVALRPALAERACVSLAHVRSQGCRLSASETEQAAELLTAVDSSPASEAALADLFGAVRKRAVATHVLSRLVLERVRADLEANGAELGAALGADPSALSRHFHDDLGLRFVEYRARLRLIAFVRLVDTGASLSRAALDAGFGSYAQCHRVFTASLGCSPRSYFKGQRQVLDAARFVAER